MRSVRIFGQYLGKDEQSQTQIIVEIAFGFGLDDCGFSAVRSGGRELAGR